MGIGRKIREQRIELGMTQEELAIAVGYNSRSTINKIESGLRDIPRKKLSAFADALGVSLLWLVLESEMNGIKGEAKK